MEDSSGDPLPSIVARAESIAQKLRELEQGAPPVAFSHVTEPAQAFLVAAIAGEIGKTFWILCPNVRSQELLYESLLNWLPNALFLPEAEFAAVENILPDPEIAAERLALLNRVQRDKAPHVIVTTRAALEQAAPDPAALNSAVLALRRGRREPLERTIEALAAAGYERVAQATTRGQFAVRGGILDVFSWQAQRPIRAEYFGDDIESSATSTRYPDIACELQSVESLPRQRKTNRTVRIVAAATFRRDRTEGRRARRNPDREGWWVAMSGRFPGAFDQGDIGTSTWAISCWSRQSAPHCRACGIGGGRISIAFIPTEGAIERFREIMGEAVKTSNARSPARGSFFRMGSGSPAGRKCRAYTRRAARLHAPNG